jgi:hypothetical protein
MEDAPVGLQEAALAWHLERLGGAKSEPRASNSALLR